MRPTHFKEANVELKKPHSMTDEECGSLWINNKNNQDGCISCWKASFVERIRFLITGKIWLGVVSGKSQPPVWMSTEAPFVEEDN